MADTRIGRAARVLRLVFTLAAVAVIVHVVDWAQFVTILRHARFELLVAAYAMFLLDRLQMSFKWGLLLAAQGVRIPLWENWSIYSLASLWATVLPATVGADALRVVWLWRRCGRGAAGTASVVLERLVGFAVGLLVSAAGVLYLMFLRGASPQLDDLLVVVGAILILVVGGLGLSFNRRVSRPVGAWLRRRATPRFAALADRLAGAYLAYRETPAAVLRFIVLTVIEQVTTLAMSYLIALAVGIAMGPLEFCAALAVGLLVSRLPVAIDGIGVFEGAMILLLSIAGIGAAETLAFALVGRFMNVLAFAPGAAVAMLRLGLDPAELRAAQRRAGHTRGLGTDG